MAIIVSHGISVEFDREPTPQGVAENLNATLALVPIEHLILVRRIEVFTPPAPPPGGEPYSGGGSGQGFPRLSVYCFDRRYRPNNYPINLTLLHEIGHIVDNHYRCSDWLLRAGIEHFRALQRHITIASSRPTQGTPEYFCDAYQKYLAGTAPPAVRDAVLATPAFAHLVGRRAVSHVVGRATSQAGW